MSTRGAYGFVKNDVFKVTYNHHDSYVKYLGKSIFDFIKNTSIEEMNQIFDKIKLIEDNEDNYWKMENYQGKLSAYKKDLDIMIDNYEFFSGSHSQYSYIINLDLNTLDFYKYGKLLSSMTFLYITQIKDLDILIKELEDLKYD